MVHRYTQLEMLTLLERRSTSYRPGSSPRIIKTSIRARGQMQRLAKSLSLAAVTILGSDRR